MFINLSDIKPSVLKKINGKLLVFEWKIDGRKWPFIFVSGEATSIKREEVGAPLGACSPLGLAAPSPIKGGGGDLSQNCSLSPIFSHTLWLVFLPLLAPLLGHGA